MITLTICCKNKQWSTIGINQIYIVFYVEHMVLSWKLKKNWEKEGEDMIGMMDIMEMEWKILKADINEEKGGKSG